MNSRISDTVPPGTPPLGPTFRENDYSWIRSWDPNTLKDNYGVVEVHENFENHFFLCFHKSLYVMDNIAARISFQVIFFIFTSVLISKSVFVLTNKRHKHVCLSSLNVIA